MHLPKAAAAALSTMALLAAPGVTTAKTADVPVDKLFPYLGNYYDLPAAQRDHFQLAYFFIIKTGSGTIGATLKGAAGDVPITIGGDGRVTPLPSAADLKAKRPVSLTAPEGLSLGVTIKLMPLTAPATQLDADNLSIAIQQAHDGAKKAAGVLGMMVPNYQTVCFDGAHSGTVTLKSGATAALKVQKSEDTKAATPCFTPADARDAVKVNLDRTPSAMVIVAKPKS